MYAKTYSNFQRNKQREREREIEDKMLIGVMAEFFPSSHYPSLLINFFMQDADN